MLAEKEGRDLSRQRPYSLCFRYTFCIEYIDNRLFKFKYLSLFILGWLSRVLDISSCPMKRSQRRLSRWQLVPHPLTAALQKKMQDEDFVARDDFEDADQLRIGNDGIFMLTFFMAFLFNWIGFFLSFCLTTSAAGRYGAISGFGLSLIKWILIVRFSTYFPGYFDGQYWLWWVFLVLGFLLFLRGSINYAKIRKMADSFSSLPQTRVLFIY
ncbi:NEDD4 family-interacting protein 1-like isoform X1 [Oncorhynchus keta]|uniref:NEDD4 family-interacting protein 1-like isoform X1 n=1 Tax=Oncorhynchus keta TaxID=8018 RepID=UPI0015FCEE37|nr:NEDD4 family-interacting protein 1-like isoform X1 [Oncorhynchus keta]